MNAFPSASVFVKKIFSYVVLVGGEFTIFTPEIMTPNANMIILAGKWVFFLTDPVFKTGRIRIRDFFYGQIRIGYYSKGGSSWIGNSGFGV